MFFDYKLLGKVYVKLEEISGEKVLIFEDWYYFYY